MADSVDLKFHQQLMTTLWSDELKYDPLKAIMYGFPWGKPNTPLEGMKGPRKWQRDYLQEIKEYYAENRSAGVEEAIFRKAVASGRGPGKSALLGMLAWFFMSTRIGGSVVVTANTEPQLLTKTMPEIAKWFRMAINSEWFTINSMSIKPDGWFADLIAKPPENGGLLIDPLYYYVSAQLWKEEVPDAFAGAHNVRGEVYMFDEAAGIPESIFSVTMGIFTEKILDKFFLVFSNPRSTSGPFFECFHKHRDDWRPTQIDTRTVKGVSPSVFESILKTYGEDSNEAKIEIYGQFPDSSEDQLIPVSLIRAAMERDVVEDAGAPLLMGVDPAGSGGDRAVIAFRRGRDARSIPMQVFKGITGDKLVTKITQAIDMYNPDGVFIDGGGLGGTIVDIVRSLGYKVFDVQAGGSADKSKTFKNKRIEMWCNFKEFLEVGMIEDNQHLFDDIKGPKVFYDMATSVMQLESKKDMRKRGLSSPDMAEALIQTFAKNFARNDIKSKTRRNRRQDAEVPYNFFPASTRI